MREIWKFLLIVFLTAGCTTAPAASTEAEPVNATSLASNPSQTAPAITRSNGPFTLTIFSPADQAILAEAQAEIRGKVSEEAVLTIDDTTYVLPAGAFTETVSLDDGLNSVQIVVSDMTGNEIDLVLTLTYQP